MEIIKLVRISFLRLVYVIVKVRVCKIHDHGNQIHPIKTKGFNFLINLVMDCFPDKFDD